MSKSGSSLTGENWWGASSQLQAIIHEHLADVRSEEAASKPAKESKGAKVAPQKAGSMISSMISTAPKPKKQPDQDPDTPPLFRKKEVTVPTKKEALSRTESLARGFVLLDIASIGAEEAWSWVVEGKDEPSLCEYIDGRNTDSQSTISSSCTSMPEPSLKSRSRTLSTTTADGSTCRCLSQRTSRKPKRIKRRSPSRRRVKLSSEERPR